MSRIPPASTRLSSGTLNYAFLGTSNYFFVNQLKQNLALQHALQLGGYLFYNYARFTKKKRKPIVHPCVLPIVSQLRAKKFFNLQFNQSQSWFMLKAQSGAVGLVLKRCWVVLARCLARPTHNSPTHPKIQPQASTTHASSCQSPKPESLASVGPKSGLGFFKLNAFNAIKTLALRSNLKGAKPKVLHPLGQPYAGGYRRFACLKKTKILPLSLLYASNVGLDRLKFPKNTAQGLDGFQKPTWTTGLACISNQRQAYRGMAKGSKKRKLSGLFQVRPESQFKSGLGCFAAHAYIGVNPGYKPLAVDFMLFCIAALAGAQAGQTYGQNALRKLTPNGLPKPTLVKKPYRYDYFNLKELSQDQSNGLTTTKPENPKISELAGLRLAHYDHHAESRDEKAFKKPKDQRMALRHVSQRTLYDNVPRPTTQRTLAQGVDLSALKMNVVPNVKPKLSVARTFLNHAQCIMFTFSEGRFAKCVRQSLTLSKKSTSSKAWLPETVSAASQKLLKPSLVSKAQTLACPNFGALRTSYGAKTKIGLTRSKTSLVFKLDFHGHNLTFQLRPTLSIRL